MFMSILKIFVLMSNVGELNEKRYLHFSNINTKTLNWFPKRELSPTNKVHKINDCSFKIWSIITNLLLGWWIETNQYIIDFLNFLRYPEIALHKLILKIGFPIILLTNLNPPKLYNDTRLKFVNLHIFLMQFIILTGNKNETVFIQRIPMTINKAQGQTLKIARINLSNQCFS